MVKIHQRAKFQANPSMHSPANARKPLRTDRRTDGHAIKRLRLVGWTYVQVKRGYFRLRTDGRTDEQPENIMPPAPKGGGITKPCAEITGYDMLSFLGHSWYEYLSCWSHLLSSIFYYKDYVGLHNTLATTLEQRNLEQNMCMFVVDVVAVDVMTPLGTIH